MNVSTASSKSQYTHARARSGVASLLKALAQRPEMGLYCLAR
jgi:hypothetical protein